MAAWVSWGGSRYFIADMGPYIGPWPLLPPAVIDAGADTSPEFDFFVALPNPAAPADPSVVEDGSYATPYWDAYRYVYDTGPPIITATGYFGGADPFGTLVPATPPAGVHLYLIYYPSSTSGPPPNPPEYYVPASYAAGGQAAFETAMGHWSTDQPGYTLTRPINGIGSIDGHAAGYSAGAQVQSEIICNDPRVDPSGTGYDPVAADQNVATVADSLISTLLGTAPVSGTGGMLVQGAKGNSGPYSVPFFSGFAGSGVVVSGEADLELFDGTALYADDRPPPPGGGRNGVDYSDTPYIDSTGAAGAWYRHNAAAAFQWLTMPITNWPAEQINAAGGYAPGLAYLPLSGDDNSVLGLEMRFVWAEGLDATTTPSWTYPHHALGDFGPAMGLTALDISTITSLAFSLHYAASYLYTGSFPASLTNFPMPPGDGSQPNNQGFGDQLFAPLLDKPVLRVDFAPWDYWIPGDIVPVGVVTYLRMTQRDDGLGIHRHPRLPVTNMPTSVQLSRAPRIGHNNRYS